MNNALTTQVLVAGVTDGPLCVLDEPLSMWGGFDAESGKIIDVHHPQYGRDVAGAIVVMTSGRGSSSASSVLAEAVRLGTAPGGFILREADEILVLGALVAEELYRISTPILIATEAAHAQLVDGQLVSIDSLGVITKT